MKRYLVLVVAAMLGGCASDGAILFDGMGDHHFAVSTRDEVAQTYFDQGLTLCYAFNHGEAVASFKEVVRRDPSCAMAWWGQAYALGPYYNSPFHAENHARAHAAIRPQHVCQ